MFRLARLAHFRSRFAQAADPEGYESEVDSADERRAVSAKKNNDRRVRREAAAEEEADVSFPLQLSLSPALPPLLDCLELSHCLELSDRSGFLLRRLLQGLSRH